MGNEPIPADPLADALLRELSEMFSAPRPSDQIDQHHLSRWQVDSEDFLQAHSFRAGVDHFAAENIKADLNAGLPSWLVEQMKLSPVGTGSFGRIAVRLEFIDLDGRGYTVLRPDVIISALSPSEDENWREDGDKRRVKVATAVSYEEFAPKRLSESVRAPISVIVITDPLGCNPPQVNYRLMQAESISELMPGVLSNFEDTQCQSAASSDEFSRARPKRETFAEAARRAYRDPKEQDFSLGQYLIEEALRNNLRQMGIVLDSEQRPEIISITASKKLGADLTVNYVIPGSFNRPNADVTEHFRFSVDNNEPIAKQVS